MSWKFEICHITKHTKHAIQLIIFIANSQCPEKSWLGIGMHLKQVITILLRYRLSLFKCITTMEFAIVIIEIE